MYGQLFCVESSRGHKPYKVIVLLNGVKITNEIDTRASTTVVNGKTFHILAQSVSALKLNVVNTGEAIPIVEKS